MNYRKFGNTGGKLLDSCKNCGFCERKCPQHLQIRKELQMVQDIFSK